MGDFGPHQTIAVLTYLSPSPHYNSAADGSSHYHLLNRFTFSFLVGLLEVVFPLIACHRGKKEQVSVFEEDAPSAAQHHFFPHFLKVSFTLRLYLTFS